MGYKEFARERDASMAHPKIIDPTAGMVVKVMTPFFTCYAEKRGVQLNVGGGVSFLHVTGAWSEAGPLPEFDVSGSFCTMQEVPSWWENRENMGKKLAL